MRLCLRFIAVEGYFCPYLLPLYRASFATMKHNMHHKIWLSHVRTLTYCPPSSFSIRKCKLVTRPFMCFIVWISGLQMRLNIGLIYLCGFLTPVDLTERRERRRDWILSWLSWLCVLTWPRWPFSEPLDEHCGELWLYEKLFRGQERTFDDKSGRWLEDILPKSFWLKKKTVWLRPDVHNDVRGKVEN